MVNHSVFKALVAQQLQQHRQLQLQLLQKLQLLHLQHTLQDGIPFESSLHRLGRVSESLTKFKYRV